MKVTDWTWQRVKQLEEQLEARNDALNELRMLLTVNAMHGMMDKLCPAGQSLARHVDRVTCKALDRPSALIIPHKESNE